MPASQTTASKLLRYDSVVRLTQYVPVAHGATTANEFIAAWREEFGAAAPDGVLYRELCRQIPEWTALAMKEIDNLIEATFIEYMIVEPWVDLSTLPTLPAVSVPEYVTVEDIYSVAFQFAKPASPVLPGALMFNRRYGWRGDPRAVLAAPPQGRRSGLTAAAGSRPGNGCAVWRSGVHGPWAS